MATEFWRDLSIPQWGWERSHTSGAEHYRSFSGAMFYVDHSPEDRPNSLPLSRSGHDHHDRANVTVGFARFQGAELQRGECQPKRNCSSSFLRLNWPTPDNKHMWWNKWWARCQVGLRDKLQSFFFCWWSRCILSFARTIKSRRASIYRWDN